MSELQFSVLINAPREKVWNVMFDKELYSQWTAIFSEGLSEASHFQGGWEKGSKIKFLSANKDGTMSGMSSQIADNRFPEFMSIQHLGVVHNDIEDLSSDEAKVWQSFENYTFSDLDGKTEVIVDITSPSDFEKYFQDTWPKALRKLKELCE